MANKNIKGITIEIDGNTSGLDKALKSVNNSSVKLNSELKDVNKLLKFDPSNATGLAQKQELLTKAISNTSDKLNQLKSAQSQVEAQFKSGNIGEEQYRAFQREIATTEQSLKGYKSQLSNLQAEQQKLGQNTDRLNTYFKASGKSIDDFADVLGGRLVNSIKNGTATSDQLEIALNKIGKGALGADVDISKFKSTLDSVKSGNSLDNVKQELQEISPKAKGASDSLDEMGNAINNGNMQRGAEAISKVGEKVLELGEKAKETALEFGSAFGKISANTNLSKAEMETLKGVATDVFKTGVTDSIETATDATILMKGAFKELNNEDLTNLTSQVISLSERTGTDVAENVRGTSQLMKAFGLDSTQAFDLVASGYKNGLNYSGDFMDTLNEYAPLFATTGYSAQEMLSILQNGMENGSMNTDKTADAVKELQIRLGDGSMDKAVESFSDNTKGVFEKWKGGQATVKDVASSIQEDLKKMSPQDQQKALSTLSTQFEDLGIKGALSLFDIKGGFDNVKGSMDSATEKDPAQEWQSSWNTFSTSLQQIGVDILTALQPVLDFFADMSEKIGSLPEPLRLFIEVVGGLIAVFTILAPILGGIALLAGGLGIAMLPFVGIVVAIIAVIALIIVAIQNWGAIVDWLKGVWGGLKDWFSNLWDGIKEVTSNVWGAISDFFSNTWKSIVDTATAIFTPIIQVFQLIFMTIASIIQGVWLFITSILQAAWNIIVSLATAIFTPIADFFSGIWTSISNKISEVWNAVTAFLSGVWNSISQTAIAIFTPIAEFLSGIWTSISTTVSNVWNSVVSFLSGIWGSISATASSVFSSIANFLSGIWNGISSAVSGAWNGIASFIGGAINGISSNVSSVFNSIKNVVSSVWDGIRSAIETPMNAAKDTVSNVINSIKGFFSGLNLKFPKIEMPKLPHFSIQGEFSLKNMTVPHLGVDWYAKGGILTKPTIFGQNGGSLMGGGEAGKEAVAPLSDLMAYVEKAVSNQIGGMDANFTQMIQLLTIIASKELSLNMDGKSVMEIIDGHMNTQQQQSQFGLGRI